MNDVDTGTLAMANDIKEALKHHLLCTFGYGGHTSELNDANYLYRAAAFTVRDRLSAPWRETRKRFAETQDRRAHYLSLEFLLGRSLNNAALNIERPVNGDRRLPQLH